VTQVTVTCDGCHRSKGEGRASRNVPTSRGEPLRWDSFGPSCASGSTLKWLAGEASAINFLYSTSWRFKAMRTPLTRTTL
jgi:hypothetical protein